MREPETDGPREADPAHEADAFETYLMSFELPEVPADAADAILGPARKEAAHPSLWSRLRRLVALALQPAWAFSMAALLFVLNLAVDGLPARIVGPGPDAAATSDLRAREARARAARDLAVETGLARRYILARLGARLDAPDEDDPNPRKWLRPDRTDPAGS